MGWHQAKFRFAEEVARFIGERDVNAYDITRAQEVLERQQQTGGYLGRLLVESGYLSEPLERLE